MKLIIDIDEKWKEKCSWFSSIDVLNYLYDIMENGTPIPDNATNGDVLKIMFPDVNMAYRCWFPDSTLRFKDTDWWNAPYQKGGK